MDETKLPAQLGSVDFWAYYSLNEGLGTGQRPVQDDSPSDILIRSVTKKKPRINRTKHRTLVLSYVYNPEDIGARARRIIANRTVNVNSESWVKFTIPLKMVKRFSTFGLEVSCKECDDPLRTNVLSVEAEKTPFLVLHLVNNTSKRTKR